MQRRNGIKTVSVVALLLAAIGLTVAFAAMSQTLTIKGTATMDSAKWDIHFENLTSSTKGAGKIIKSPTLQENGTYIGDFEVSLSKPGDSVSFHYDIVNAGDIDAKYTDYLIHGIPIQEETELDEVLKILYEEGDWDGDGETTSEERLKSLQITYVHFVNEIDQYDVLNAGERTSGRLTIGFDSEATELPKGNITMKLNFQMIFEQA